jgi:hypothetical protein
MKMNVDNAANALIKFLDSSSENFLLTDSVIISNGIWNVHIDYEGQNPKQGLDNLKIFVHHKKEILNKILYSKSASDILTAAEAAQDYFNYREFSVSVGARDNFILMILLRINAFFRRYF